ncbi:MAG: anion transporter [Calditerrivibrio sp.]|nr:anion transporter [Calditerrivibrio sp.]
MIVTILLICSLTAIAIGYIPKFRMNRTTIALVSATFLVVTGGIGYEDAIKSIHFDTIILLFSMMIINANFGVSGFFNLISMTIIKRAKTPKKLLFIIIFTSGLLSSLLLNDTVAIMFTPIVINMLAKLNRNPIPYLIGLGMATNIGSAMTPIGNPQNMLIASYSGMSFIDFVTPLFAVSIVSLFVLYYVIMFFYKDEFNNIEIVPLEFERIRLYKPLLIKSIIATSIMLVMFFLKFSVAYSALVAAAILLFTRRIKPERVFREIDWSLLVFFSSLFVITTTVQSSGLGDKLYHIFKNYIFSGITPFSISMALFSNIVSNVPAVMLFSPFIKTIENPYQYWIIAAMSSTFAGNLTIIGSVANIIVVELALKHGIKINFTNFFKTGVVITITTISIGVIWLNIIF